MMPTSIATAHEQIVGLRAEIERLRVEIAEWETAYEASDTMRDEICGQLGKTLAVLGPLLEHYLDCYDGNRDQLAINAEALLADKQ